MVYALYEVMVQGIEDQTYSLPCATQATTKEKLNKKILKTLINDFPPENWQEGKLPDIFEGWETGFGEVYVEDIKYFKSKETLNKTIIKRIFHK